MKKSRGIAVLLLTAIVTVFFCYVAAVGIGPTGTGSAKNINTGLDLAGGVSITYQAKDSNPSKEDMSDTVYKMQQRVSQYSTEAQAYQEGSNRITIEIPGRTWKTRFPVFHRSDRCRRKPELYNRKQRERICPCKKHRGYPEGRFCCTGRYRRCRC